MRFCTIGMGCVVYAWGYVPLVQWAGVAEPWSITTYGLFAFALGCVVEGVKAPINS